MQVIEISKAEYRVFEFLYKGLTSKQIAEKLHVSHRTVDYQIQSIYKKTNIHSKVALVVAILEKRIELVAAGKKGKACILPEQN